VKSASTAQEALTDEDEPVTPLKSSPKDTPKKKRKKAIDASGDDTTSQEETPKIARKHSLFKIVKGILSMKPKGTEKSPRKLTGDASDDITSQQSVSQLQLDTPPKRRRKKHGKKHTDDVSDEEPSREESISPKRATDPEQITQTDHQKESEQSESVVSGAEAEQTNEVESKTNDNAEQQAKQYEGKHTPRESTQTIESDHHTQIEPSSNAPTLSLQPDKTPHKTPEADPAQTQAASVTESEQLAQTEPHTHQATTDEAATSLPSNKDEKLKEDSIPSSRSDSTPICSVELEKLLDEMLAREADYLLDLRKLMDVFVLPAFASKINELMALEPHINQLITIHKHVSERLSTNRTLIKQNQMAQLGSMLSGLVDSFDCYATYRARQLQLIALLQLQQQLKQQMKLKSLASSSTFDNASQFPLLQFVQSRSSAQLHLSLEDLLHIPIHHLAAFTSSIELMIHHIPTHSDDFKEAYRALTKLRHLIEVVGGGFSIQYNTIDPRLRAIQSSLLLPEDGVVRYFMFTHNILPLIVNYASSFSYHRSPQERLLKKEHSNFWIMNRNRRRLRRSQTLLQ